MIFASLMIVVAVHCRTRVQASVPQALRSYRVRELGIASLCEVGLAEHRLCVAWRARAYLCRVGTPKFNCLTLIAGNYLRPSGDQKRLQCFPADFPPSLSPTAHQLHSFCQSAGSITLTRKFRVIYSRTAVTSASILNVLAGARMACISRNVTSQAGCEEAGGGRGCHLKRLLHV